MLLIHRTGMRREPFFTSSRSPPLLHFIIEQSTHIPINFHSTVHRYYFHKSNSALNNPRCDNDPMVSRPQCKRTSGSTKNIAQCCHGTGIHRSNEQTTRSRSQLHNENEWLNRGGEAPRPQFHVIAELFSSRLLNSLLPAGWCTFKLPVLSL